MTDAAVGLVLGMVLAASFFRGDRSLVRDFGLSFTGMDVLVGVLVGLTLRLVVFGIGLMFYGRIQIDGATLGSVVHDWW